MLKVVVADDHVLLIEAIRSFAHELDPTMQVIIATSFPGAMACLDQHRDTDVVLLDLDMPGMTGAGSIAEIRQNFPTVRCAILTGRVNPETAREAFSWGVDGFVPKHVAGRPLLQILRLIATGEKYVPPDLVMEPAKAPPAIAEELTARELAILHRVAEGKSNKAIAREIGVEPGTVGQHLHRVFAKLRVTNRTEATRAFLAFSKEA